MERQRREALARVFADAGALNTSWRAYLDWRRTFFRALPAIPFKDRDNLRDADEQAEAYLLAALTDLGNVLAGVRRQPAELSGRTLAEVVERHLSSFEDNLAGALARFNRGKDAK